jgi:hypothetical protein
MIIVWMEKARNNCWKCALTAFIIQTAQNAAIRTALNMGIFDKIPFSGGGISVTDLSALLKVDERLLSESKAPLRVENSTVHR